MKSERFRRTKSVMASSAIALVVAALAFGVAHTVVRPSDAKMSLTSGSGFTIKSNIYSNSACSGSTAKLYPGTTRYICFTVQNNLTVPISVGSISMALSNNPPVGCTAVDLSLPTFSGSLNVSGSGLASTTGLPIELKDDGNQSPQCENQIFDFIYSGSAQYTDATTISLASASPGNTSTSGSAVTFTATVTEANASGDPSGPAGTVIFNSCTSNTCGSTTSLGSGTVGSSGQATFSTSTLPVGANYVEAVYGGSGTNLTGSTSNVLTQTVTSGSISTTSKVTSAPNPSTSGTSVTFTDSVSASSGTPDGTVSFYSCATNTCSTKTSLGTGTLASGKATLSTSMLPVGTTYVEAVYSASGNYGGSTSNVVTQVVLNVPSVCAAGGYADIITGTPANPFLYGTNGNDLIHAFGASYWINGLAGNDCVDAGDGNNLIFDGNGNDGVVAGKGSDIVILGNGNDKVSLGNGSDGVQTGNGNDVVTLGNGSGSEIIVGGGNDTVTIGTGSYNEVELGGGTDAVTIQGSHDDIEGGAGNETIYLGSGTYNSYRGQAHHTNVCHVPALPSSYHGSKAAYYHDTITDCTVVSP